MTDTTERYFTECRYPRYLSGSLNGTANPVLSTRRMRMAGSKPDTKSGVSGV